MYLLPQFILLTLFLLESGGSLEALATRANFLRIVHLDDLLIPLIPAAAKICLLEYKGCLAKLNFNFLISLLDRHLILPLSLQVFRVKFIFSTAFLIVFLSLFKSFAILSILNPPFKNLVILWRSSLFKGLPRPLLFEYSA